ncbi:amphi-Trp domain-containing protein [Corynebacterium imitans]|uniref:amphi-Trp domain-containing protein n=1 Tax=Corynebacterium imitans TaxID=156978 RepID=UPI00254D3D5C|nr:amphi-Trp domain-containing protein [Corynebacterium imitans]MDK8306890.1 amphi-Trp domain-containing protein [Corynebacterium imitans]MDK8638320.1 amphi-Trp domain-containing protein [Corynebacterium imitans]MDK8773485.1 amphi-Trp domain-containing protein [Corynebacterium imitans]
MTAGTPPARKSPKLLKSRMDFGRDDLAELLESLAERIRAGEMTLGTGNSSLTMALPGTFRTTLEVADSQKRRGIKRELELELEWYVDENGDPLDTDAPDSGFAVS